MKFMRTNSIFVNSMRFLMATFVCGLVFFSTLFPVVAADNYPSSLTKGEDQLTEIQRRTDKSAYDPAMTMEEIQKRQEPEKGGINEIQGAADMDKMKNPQTSRHITTPIDKVKEVLGKAEK